jgi:hypothetical protein
MSSLSRIVEVVDKQNLLFIEEEQSIVPTKPYKTIARYMLYGVATLTILTLISLAGVLLSGTQDVLKEPFLPWLQSQSRVVLLLIIASLTGIIALLGWSIDRLWKQIRDN